MVGDGRRLCIAQTDALRLVPTGHGRPLGGIAGAEVPLEGLLEAVAVGVEAAGGVVLTGLRAPLRRGLHLPGQGGAEDRDSEGQ